MGKSSSKHSTTHHNNFNLKDWEQVPPGDRLPNYRVNAHNQPVPYRNRITGEMIDVYKPTFLNQQDYQMHLESLNFRRNEPHIVRALYYEPRMKKQFCSTTYGMTVGLQHVKGRLSEYIQIPWRDSLYCMMAMLDGYKKLYDQIGRFPVSEDQVIIDNQGQVRVWVNSDLIKNQPQQSEFAHTFNNRRSQRWDEGQYEMVNDIIGMVTESTDDAEGPPLKFADYYARQKLNYNNKVGFQQAKAMIHDYAQLNNVAIPNVFESVLDIYMQNQGGYVDDELQVRQEPADGYDEYPMDGYSQRNYSASGYGKMGGAYLNSGLMLQNPPPQVVNSVVHTAPALATGAIATTAALAPVMRGSNIGEVHATRIEPNPFHNIPSQTSNYVSSYRSHDRLQVLPLQPTQGVMTQNSVRPPSDRFIPQPTQQALIYRASQVQPPRNQIRSLPPQRVQMQAPPLSLPIPIPKPNIISNIQRVPAHDNTLSPHSQSVSPQPRMPQNQNNSSLPPRPPQGAQTPKIVINSNVINRTGTNVVNMSGQTQQISQMQNQSKGQMQGHTFVKNLPNPNTVLQMREVRSQIRPDPTTSDLSHKKKQEAESPGLSNSQHYQKSDIPQKSDSDIDQQIMNQVEQMNKRQSQQHLTQQKHQQYSNMNRQYYQDNQLQHNIEQQDLQANQYINNLRESNDNNGIGNDQLKQSDHSSSQNNDKMKNNAFIVDKSDHNPDYQNGSSTHQQQVPSPYHNQSIAYTQQVSSPSQPPHNYFPLRQQSSHYQSSHQQLQKKESSHTENNRNVYANNGMVQNFYSQPQNSRFPFAHQSNAAGVGLQRANTYQQGVTNMHALPLRSGISYTQQSSVSNGNSVQFNQNLNQQFNANNNIQNLSNYQRQHTVMTYNSSNHNNNNMGVSMEAEGNQQYTSGQMSSQLKKSGNQFYYTIGSQVQLDPQIAADLATLA